VFLPAKYREKWLPTLHLGRSMLLEAIALDPVLGGVGDAPAAAAAAAAAKARGGGGGAGGQAAAGGARLYLTPDEHEVGQMQNWGVWGEKNAVYLRDVGRFLEGLPGSLGGLASRVCGSADLIRGSRSSAKGRAGSFHHVILQSSAATDDSRYCPCKQS
jgi:hypothetical protein